VQITGSQLLIAIQSEGILKMLRFKPGGGGICEYPVPPVSSRRPDDLCRPRRKAATPRASGRATTAGALRAASISPEAVKRRTTNTTATVNLTELEIFLHHDPIAIQPYLLPY